MALKTPCKHERISPVIQKSKTAPIAVWCRICGALKYNGRWHHPWRNHKRPQEHGPWAMDRGIPLP